MRIPEQDSLETCEAIEILDQLVTRLELLTKTLDRAAFVARHLHGMVDQDTWRANGDYIEGKFEGDYHACQVHDEIQSWKMLAGGCDVAVEVPNFLILDSVDELCGAVEAHGVPF